MWPSLNSWAMLTTLLIYNWSPSKYNWKPDLLHILLPDTVLPAYLPYLLPPRDPSPMWHTPTLPLVSCNLYLYCSSEELLPHPQHLTLAQVKLHSPIFCPIYESINTFLNLITTPSAIHLPSKLCVICKFGKPLHPSLQIIDVNN